MRREWRYKISASGVCQQSKETKDVGVMEILPDKCFLDNSGESLGTIGEQRSRNNMNGSYIVIVIGAASHAFECYVAIPTRRTIGINFKNESATEDVSITSSRARREVGIKIDVVDELATDVAADET